MSWLGGRAETVEGDADDPLDLLGRGGAQPGDAADHFGDVGDVDVTADGAGFLGAPQQWLAGVVDPHRAGLEEGRVAVHHGEHLVGQDPLRRGEGDDFEQPAGQRLPGLLAVVAAGGGADLFDPVDVGRLDQVLTRWEVAV